MIHHRRVRVGHREDGRDTSGEGGRGARGKVLLVNRSWIAGVHVHVDEARQLDHPARRRAVRVRFHARRSSADHSHRLRDNANTTVVHKCVSIISETSVRRLRNVTLHGVHTSALVSLRTIRSEIRSYFLS